MNWKCPGIDSRNLKLETLSCPHCNYEVELFSDEMRVACPQCGKEVGREKPPACIDWCDYARECVGEERWATLQQDITESKRDNVREKVLLEMCKYFKADGRRIRHAELVLSAAEKILAREGGDARIVTCTAILHDIGIPECERKYGSADGQLQEQEGPPVAREILEKLGIKDEVITEVCRIIAGHHSPGEVDTPEFRVIWDADQIINLREGAAGRDKARLKKAIEKTFLTATGREIAENTYLDR